MRCRNFADPTCGVICPACTSLPFAPSRLRTAQRRACAAQPQIAGGGSWRRPLRLRSSAWLGCATRARARRPPYSSRPSPPRPTASSASCRMASRSGRLSCLGVRQGGAELAAALSQPAAAAAGGAICSSADAARGFGRTITDAVACAVNSVAPAGGSSGRRRAGAAFRRRRRGRRPRLDAVMWASLYSVATRAAASLRAR